MGLVVTEAHLQAATAAGACGERARLYPPGTSLHEVSQEDLAWVEENMPDLAALLSCELARGNTLVRRGVPPLSGYGDGYGSGYGDGYGYGYGYGDGSGSGDGYGDGGQEEG